MVITSRFMVCAALLAFLSIWCMCKKEPLPPPTIEEEIKITEPQQGNEVPRIATVKGSTNKVPTGTRIWVYVHPQGDLPYKQTNPGIVTTNGAWESPGCIFGRKNDPGKWFTFWGKWEKADGTTLCSDTIAVTRENADTTLFGFEENYMGWEHGVHHSSLAITYVKHTSEEAFLGAGCLKMSAQIIGIGLDTSYAQGEAVVDLRYHPPEGVTAPINLLGVEITAWIFAPTGTSGPPGDRNYFQVIVKDSKWNTECGTATDVLENEWFKITLIPSTTLPEGGRMDPGFDPTDIVMVGVKVGSRADSTYQYIGSLYMDSFDW